MKYGYLLAVRTTCLDDSLKQFDTISLKVSVMCFATDLKRSRGGCGNILQSRLGQFANIMLGIWWNVEKRS